MVLKCTKVKKKLKSVMTKKYRSPSILHHTHQPPWLGIKSANILGVLRGPYGCGQEPMARLNRPLVLQALMVGSYADSSNL